MIGICDAKMLRYSVSMPRPNTHYFEVKIVVTDFKNLVSDPSKLHAIMPVWTPGSYLVREFSKNVLDLQARIVDTEREARSYKVSKNEWIVETEGSQEIEINYKVYAFELSVNTSYLDGMHGIVNGASVFMYVQGMEKVEGILQVNPFPDWKKISTGLDRIGTSDSNEFLIPNYDILVDSPIEIGNQNIHDFNINGIKYEVSIFNVGKFDEVKFVSD